MKTLIPALCGALLLASSLPAAAHQAKVNDFGGNQTGAASQASRSGLSTVPAESSARQLFDRNGATKAGRIPGIQSTVEANTGRTFAEPRAGGATGQVMDWNAKRPSTGTYPHLQR